MRSNFIGCHVKITTSLSDTPWECKIEGITTELEEYFYRISFGDGAIYHLAISSVDLIQEIRKPSIKKKTKIVREKNSNIIKLFK